MDKIREVDNLFLKVTDFGNLLNAAKKAYIGTRKNKENLEFMFNKEKNILYIKEKLEKQIYEPGQYRVFTIYDPKERDISVAKFEDRVVHHAVVNVIEPIYEKVFIYDSYACRKNKGTHKAVYRAQNFLRKNIWYLKCDIKKYFYNIDQKKLIEIMSKKIKDNELNNLIKRIIENGGINGKGLPIGNLTSQFFANVYLNELDYYIKHQLRERYYIRYMDDFIVFSNDKSKLKIIKNEITNFLNKELKLEPKNNTVINNINNGLSFLGVRIYPELIRIKSEFNRFIEGKEIINYKTEFIKDKGKNYICVFLEYDISESTTNVFLDISEKNRRYINVVKNDKLKNNPVTNAEIKFENEKDNDLFNKLKIWRKERAEKDGIPVFIILTNIQMKDIIIKKPVNKTELKRIKGIGNKKTEKYAEEIIKIFGEKND